MQNSQPLGESISPAVEVTHISSHGVWLFTSAGEMFMPYEHFPWFENARVSEILNVKEPSPGHFYWPDLDIDLSAEIIASPESYPLVSRH
jgi:Protein of unknown function (DUF2442)